jgi:hypothetical protein
MPILGSSRGLRLGLGVIKSDSDDSITTSEHREISGGHRFDQNALDRNRLVAYRLDRSIVKSVRVRASPSLVV